MFIIGVAIHYLGFAFQPPLDANLVYCPVAKRYLPRTLPVKWQTLKPGYICVSSQSKLRFFEKILRSGRPIELFSLADLIRAFFKPDRVDISAKFTPRRETPERRSNTISRSGQCGIFGRPDPYYNRSIMNEEKQLLHSSFLGCLSPASIHPDTRILFKPIDLDISRPRGPPLNS